MSKSNMIPIDSDFYDSIKYNILVLKSTRNIDLTDSFTENLGDNTCTFLSGSPCISSFKNNMYIVNVRYWTHTKCDKYHITRNKKYILDKNLEPDNGVLINDDLIIHSQISSKNKKSYLGIEDIKLFRDGNNKIMFTGTMEQDDNRMVMVMGYYPSEINNNVIDTFNVLESSIKAKIEKNWVIIPSPNKDLQLIQKWDPLTIGTVLNNSVFNITSIKKLKPDVFKYVSGSTNGFLYDNQIWFIVHLKIVNPKRNYMYMFVVFDTSMNLIKYSRIFKFSQKYIEFCLGLIIEPERVIISYSIDDKQTLISIFSLEHINSLFI